ncbi:PLP-dependent aminotransferase family protein [Sphingobacterium gobiense]|nr:PLP-dependent aminotransferase family protein [Sphingobacterium gobiense]
MQQKYYLSGLLYGSNFNKMSSPVLDLFSSFVFIDRTSMQPIYLQVSQQVINAVQRGYLLVGTKLPGTRALSEVLQVHRKTVIAIYNELDAQGWVEVRPNKGTFVVNQSHQVKIDKPYQKLVSLARYPDRTGFSFRQSPVLDNPFESSDCRLIFNDGQPDIRLTQMQQLSRSYSASMKRKPNLRRLTRYQAEGSEYFREQLSNYLNFSRGLHISKSNLLITRSVEMSLYIISQILLSKDDHVLVGDLSMFSANMVFQKMGARVLTIPVDEKGIDVDYIRTHFNPGEVRMVYVTPHHHYPTTVTLSAQRRIALLQLAQEYGFVIVEDDYDYDFQYEQTAVMPLASGDVDGMVVYIGSFGKSLAPTFQTGFVVAPDNLIAEMRKYLSIIDQQGDVIMEQALAEMIAEGEIHRHLKKSLKIYRERRDLFCEILDTCFSDVVTFKKPSGGLALWTTWNKSLSLLQVANLCRNQDLFIPKNILYQNSTLSAMRLGFGHLNEIEIEEVLTILRRGVEKIS